MIRALAQARSRIRIPAKLVRGGGHVQKVIVVEARLSAINQPQARRRGSRCIVCHLRR